MKSLELKTSKALLPIGPYSQAVRVGDLLFMSGILPIDVQSKALLVDIEGATKKIFEHLDAILGEAGLGRANVVKSTIFMKDLTQFAELNKVYGAYFTDVKVMPARSTVQVAKLPLDAVVEMEFIASF